VSHVGRLYPGTGDQAGGGGLEVIHRDEPGGEFGDGDLGFDGIIELALVGLDDSFD